MKKIISFVLIIGNIISCDFGTDHEFNEQVEISKIYQFNISDSLTNYLVDGFVLNSYKNLKSCYIMELLIYGSMI